MVETVACVTSLSDACSVTKVKLSEVVDSSFGSEQQSAFFQDLAGRAITNAISAPQGQGAVDVSLLDLTGHSGTQIAERKSELLGSTADSLGTSTGSKGGTSEAVEMVSMRIRNLYMELTQFQVAWKVGHKVQQDIAQILRGQ